MDISCLFLSAVLPRKKFIVLPSILQTKPLLKGWMSKIYRQLLRRISIWSNIYPMPPVRFIIQGGIAERKVVESSSLLLFTFATFLRFIGVEPSIVNIGGQGTENFWKSLKESINNFNPFRTIVATRVHLSMTTYHFQSGYGSYSNQMDTVTDVVEK